MAGHVVSIGKGVTRFAIGDEVFGEGAMKTLPGTELPIGSGATFAEYAVANERWLARKPRNVTFEQAAVVPMSGYVALCALGSIDGLKGQRLLINGAGGCVGSLAVQIAKAAGAHVTAVDRTEKLEMLRLLGADLVIDYARESVPQRDERYDLVLDVASTLPLSTCTRILTANGIYRQVGHGHYGKVGGRLLGCMMGGSIPRSFDLSVRLLVSKHFSTVKFNGWTKPAALSVLTRLLRSGALAPIVARTFPLDDIPAAMRCLEEERAPGRIVITP